MKDRLGVEVKPGCYIAYAAAAGRCSVLHIGRVVDVVDREANYYNQKPYQKAKVELLEEGFGVAYTLRRTGKPKIVYIMFPERMLVIDHVPKQEKAVHGE